MTLPLKQRPAENKPAGPDYWSINKQWALCSSGRLQSPIDISTSSLVFDHSLAPLAFAWAQPAELTPATLSAFADGSSDQFSATRAESESAQVSNSN